MGILDDAIKEHLELKRAHGADAAELKQLEDEAFGAAERPGDEESAPDPAAEAPTEFMQQPDLEAVEEAEEPPVEPPEQAEPAEEEAPAMEHEAIAEPPPPPEPPPPAEEPAPPTGPTTEEREAIAEQPTEMYDIEEELAAAQPEAEAEEELIEAEDEEDDDFWDEKRLSDELDQALEAPVDIEEEPPPAAQEPPAEEPAPASEPAPDEDVLEETPDFLEEAPEDDQLWFEQKPPKDFDFDD